MPDTEAWPWYTLILLTNPNGLRYCSPSHHISLSSLNYPHGLSAAVWQEELLLRPPWPFLRSYKLKCTSQGHDTTQASCPLRQGDPAGNGNPDLAGLSPPKQRPNEARRTNLETAAKSPGHEAASWWQNRSEVKLEIQSIDQGYDQV